MRKKCIPGLICIENMTLFILFVIAIFLLLILFRFNNNNNNNNHDKFVVVSQPLNVPPPAVIGPLQSISTRAVDPFNDPYSPPLKTNDLFYPIISGRDVRPTPRIPINIETNGYSQQYSQIGILTRKDGKDDLIIPLMGRRIINGRDKWQYYTLSNTGNLNTKLPITFKGKSCTSDTGCDEIYNNDTLYVSGYKDKFEATIYDNEKISYIPVI